MCGFVAVIGPAPALSDAVLTAMRDRLAHRGPDGAANWSWSGAGGSVSLGFRRLAILDTRHVADQPMVSADGRKVLVFNGEIYNFVELREELMQLGCVFRTRSDTEVLLHAYERWGDAMVGRLNGMFAFVLWDGERGEALIARDRFGEKPLYCCTLPDGSRMFASEIKALLAHPAAPVSVDTGLLSEVLKGRLLFAAPETLFAGVTQFAAAHRMVIALDGRIRSDDRYWSPSYERTLDGVPHAQLVERLRDHLERSVAMRMRSDVPVTACLSGGLDSSALVALMAQQGGVDSVISARFPADATMDEGHYIDAVLRHLQLRGHTVTPTAADLAGDIRRMHWHHETVIPGSSMYLEWAIMRAARQHGYKVIIDGQGGDEVFAGYSIYLQAYQAELWRKAAWPSAMLLGLRRDWRLAREAKKYTDAGRRFSSRERLSFSQLRHFHAGHMTHMQSVYGGDGVPSWTNVGGLRFELAINLMRTSLPSNLYSGDRNAMAHGIESRYPFLDYDLVDFANQLPDAAYLGRAWGKNILRHAVEDRLPQEIVWRVDKVGFAAPQDVWMRHPSMRSWIEERIFDNSLNAVEGYHFDTMERLWHMHTKGQVDLSDTVWRWASAAEVLDMNRSQIWHNGL